MASSFSEFLSFHVTKQINLFPWLPLLTLNLPFTKVNLVFQGNYIGTMHLAPQKNVGDTVPKLDSANGDVMNGMRPVSWQA